MLSLFAQVVASLTLLLKQPLYSFCDLETSHGNALVTRRGDYVSFLRIDGLRRMATKEDVERIALAQRQEISGLLEQKGHAIVGWYSSDPQLSSVEVERLNLKACRRNAALQGLDLDDILTERGRRWPSVMRWEAAYYVLWTRRSVLTKEESRQTREELEDLAKQWNRVGESQRYYVRSEMMAARHTAFVDRVAAALRNQDIACQELDAHAAVKVARETLYRETAGSEWRAVLMGDSAMPRLPEETGAADPHPEGLFWPAIREQLFYADAETKGGQRVEIGEFEYLPVDMVIGPDNPRPFVELAARLGRDRVPWRASIIIEGGGRTAMSFKEIAAGFLTMFPANREIRRAFDALRKEQEDSNHISVRFRASFATWAAASETKLLRRRGSMLAQRLEGWGNCKATMISGDPLEAAMSSVPGLALASTATPSLALLDDALAMLPWNRSATIWQEGSMLFRKPDGAIFCYDPTGGDLRPVVCDIFVSPPGGGKSVIANAINLGLCLSTAALGTRGAKLPFIGKLDIGTSGKGFIDLLRNALGPKREHEAIFVTMQFAPGYEVNCFDLQLGCEYPLPLERAFLQNFLALLTLPLDGAPFEGMNHLIGFVIDEVYRLCTNVPNGSPKLYACGVEREVDAAIERCRLELPRNVEFDGATMWRDVVNALIGVGEHRLADVAQRHAVPVMKDLIAAARTTQVKDRFAEVISDKTSENLPETFQRYIYDFIGRYETLSKPTRLDFGPARVIVIDLGAVALAGSLLSDRQTEMMYLLGRHMLARNFFVHPDYLGEIPLHVREYHRERFQEMVETIKRLDYDEWHRTKRSPQVREQAARDVREGRKHNVQMGFASQELADIGEEIVNQSTGRFILKTGTEASNAQLIELFNLSNFSARLLRTNGLPGPGPEGAPFLFVMNVGGVQYEQLLVNTLGPIELWSLSTTPADTALRDRLYARLGSSEALRRLSRVFPKGSAVGEIDYRKRARLNRGEADEEAVRGVVDEVAAELVDGHGIGMRLRDSHPANDDMPPRVAAE